VWRCHVGRDDPQALARSTWDFLLDDVQAADACIFSRAEYAWDGLIPDRVVTFAPCIDLASPKNRPLPNDRRDALLASAGIVPNGRRADDVRPALMVEDAPVPPPARLTVQVSRWDRLKDPVGLIRAFGLHGPTDEDAHLLVVGPAVDGVGDDPEDADVHAEACAAWRALPPAARRKLHLVCVPMDDPAQNAIVVNAVQRRPVVASRVGGVQDQIVHGESGVLVDDPADLESFGRAIRGLTADRGAARAMGEAAHAQVCERFLPVHHFEGERDLIARMLAA
jgi:trehalose synthase